MIALFVAIVIALGGGASFMAETSVPGDALYGVKTSINENVRGILAMGAEADAKWEAELALRRLDEAAELEKRGELTAEAAATLSAEFASHTDAALAVARNIGSSGQDGVAVDIHTRLKAAIEASVSAPRDRASGQATGKSMLIVPPVLQVAFEYEVKAPRDVATGQSSGKIIQTGDVTGDGSAEVKTETVDADSDGAGEASVDSQTSVDAKVKASYDLKTNTR